MRKSLAVGAALIALAATTPAEARAVLMKSWFQNGNQMCEYSDGTVLNVGGRTCPTSIG
jgi:hypothetical protein